MKYFLLLLAIFNISFGKSDPKLILFNTTVIDPTTKEITITFIVPEKDFIYKDFITCSVHEPTIKLSSWKANKESVNHYDPSFKETKQVFNETFSITAIAALEHWIPDPIHLYCSYYRKTDKKIKDTLFTFSFPQPLQTNIDLAGTIEPVSVTDSKACLHKHHRPSLFEQYYAKMNSFSREIITFLAYHRTTGLSLLLIAISLLLFFFHLYQENLRKYKKLYELLELIISLVIFIITSYGIWYLYWMNKPFSKLLASGIAILFLMISAIFYIKKSTNVSLRSIRTFYTCAGMICVIIMIILLFKTLQHADQQMNLFS
jgi:hypothetical protein